MASTELNSLMSQINSLSKQLKGIRKDKKEAKREVRDMKRMLNLKAKGGTVRFKSGGNVVDSYDY